MTPQQRKSILERCEFIASLHPSPLQRRLNFLHARAKVAVDAVEELARLREAVRVRALAGRGAQ